MSSTNVIDLSRYDENWIVYAGTGGGIYNRPGNQNFLRLVRDRLDEWDGNTANTRILSTNIRKLVYTNGGCFVITEGNQVTEMPEEKILFKIRRTFINESVARKTRSSPEELVAMVEARASGANTVRGTEGTVVNWTQTGSTSSSSQSHSAIQGVTGVDYNLNVSHTFLDDNHQYVHETVALSGGTIAWEASSVGSTRIPYSTWLAFLSMLVLQMVILIIVDKPWKYILVICKMFDAAPYIKTRTVDPEQKTLHIPLLKELQTMLAKTGLIVIAQIYSGNESPTEGWRANSIHVDDHGDYEKVIVRIGGEFAFFANFLGLGGSFFSFACRGMARIILGTDMALGKSGSGILHSGVKEKEQMTLVLQLRPDGIKWPWSKKFTVENTRQILVELEDFVVQTVHSEGGFTAELRRAQEKGVLDKETILPVVAAFEESKAEPERLQVTANLLNKTLQPKLFNDEVFSKLHYYSPQSGKTTLAEELETAYAVHANGTMEQLGFHSNKDILMAKGRKDRLDINGKAWNTFVDMVVELDHKKAETEKDKVTNHMSAEFFNEFHSKTGGWIYRSCGTARDQQLVIQRLSCQDLVRTKSSRKDSASRLLLRQGRFDFEERKKAPTQPNDSPIAQAFDVEDRKKTPAQNIVSPDVAEPPHQVPTVAAAPKNVEHPSSTNKVPKAPPHQVPTVAAAPKPSADQIQREKGWHREDESSTGGVSRVVKGDAPLVELTRPVSRKMHSAKRPWGKLF